MLKKYIIPFWVAFFPGILYASLSLEEKCLVEVDQSTPSVKQCKLTPSLSRYHQCYVAIRKQDGNSLVADNFIDQAKAAENRGEQIMLAKTMPNSKKRICGNYLKCLKTYVELLPRTTPLGIDDTLPYNGSEKIREKYREVANFCANNHYTIKTKLIKFEEKTADHNGFRNVMGVGVDTSKTITQESTQVIVVKPNKGRIINVPLSKYASSKKESDHYVFDQRNCTSHLEKNDDEINKHLNPALVMVDSSSRYKKFTDNTSLLFKIAGVNPVIDIDWGYFLTASPVLDDQMTMKHTHTSIYSDKSKYIAKNQLLREGTFKPPKALEIMTYGNLMGARKLLAPGVTVSDAEKCDMLEIDTFFKQAPNLVTVPRHKISYTYEIEIYPSTQSEQKEARSIIRQMGKNRKDPSKMSQQEQAFYSLNGVYRTVLKKENKKKEPNSIFDVLNQTTYDNLSDSDKEEWDKEKLSKQAEKEFSETSMDDLEMFTD